MPLRLLAVSGSLRAASSNSRLIAALGRLAPPDVEIVVYDGLGDLPHFNPDLDGDAPPFAVLDWRRRIGECDGLIICSPEYAHGVAGAMKNALDWLVPSLEFPEKPVALINASPRAAFAQAHMRETLSVMSARLVDAASIAVPLQGRNLTANEIVADPDLGPALRQALADFVAFVRANAGAA